MNREIIILGEYQTIEMVNPTTFKQLGSGLNPDPN
jgi:hypothetical protein